MHREEGIGQAYTIEMIKMKQSRSEAICKNLQYNSWKTFWADKTTLLTMGREMHKKPLY